MPRQGSLVCISLGMRLAGHISPVSKSHLEKADVVFSAISDGVTELWLQELHPNVISLQQYYQEGKSRKVTYQQMVDAMVSAVRDGHRVVGAFYGHAGVFTYPSHKAIQICRNEGFEAHMEPGISAEDCLYADAGIDPGKYGCQSYEASQFMFYQRIIDPSAYLILWQVGVTGDKSLARFSTHQDYLAVLVELLRAHYPSEHQVMLYEAATLPIYETRMEWVTLDALPKAQMHLHTTLMVPPSVKLKSNTEILERLGKIAEAFD
ncbi:SAM-dependent methyltransferase [Echinimonas agarilytica]|uniref:SAM-dependent methyltransferase n=1 Tax=Echinimonas agarilytica TaxID=1215918 RepID=A0AA42B8I8_9GAMM|nr:SAM-dependent methyltransferase [Echinimonas agarilytica]MCM2680994.1 SAM-dependent methyltransferase [Echinimonas agarilytica]